MLSSDPFVSSQELITCWFLVIPGPQGLAQAPYGGLTPTVTNTQFPRYLSTLVTNVIIGFYQRYTR